MCDGSVERLISAPSIQFKGSGFYVTDKRAPKSTSKTASKAKSKSTDTKKDTGKTKTDKSDKSSSPKKAATAEAKTS